MPRAVVTGAAGFIGSHLVTRLVREGFDVVMIDNLSTGRKENIFAALAEAGVSSKAEFVELDLAEAVEADPSDAPDGVSKIPDVASMAARGADINRELERALRGADYVFHLAALADIVPSIQEPLAYHRANVDGTAQLLEAVRAVGGVKKFVYAASSSCYGLADVLPTPETAAIDPQYPYALTKYIAEQYVFHWSQVYGIPALSLRFFNVYGPRSRTGGTYGAVFGVFLAQKLAGQPMTVVGDGSQTRDFVYVSDVADALLRAAQSEFTREAFNVGSGRPQSVRRLCELIGGPTVNVPKRPGEPDCTWADTLKIGQMLGWWPKVTFEEGVATMVETIQHWRSAPVWTPDGIEKATVDWFKYLGGPRQPRKDQPQAAVSPS